MRNFRTRTLGFTAALLACWLCLSGCALAFGETGELLSPDDLTRLQPAYEKFVNELADLIIARGLLPADQRDAWFRYQMGDYFQNGGYGMIAAMYSPDLLELARPQDSLLRLEKPTPHGTLRIDTLGAYDPLDATLPGLMLEASLTDAQGLPVACRFRWHCEQGGFIAWDSLNAAEVNVGNSFTNDGRICYWTDQPPAPDSGGVWVIDLDILSPTDDAAVLSSASLTLTQQGTGWALDYQALQ